MDSTAVATVLISSGISAFALIASSLISFFIAKNNNKHQIKMLREERYKESEKHNADAIDNYLKAAGELMFAPSHEFEDKFASTISEMLEHISAELHDKIKSFNNNVANTRTLYSSHGSPDYLKLEYYDLVAAVNKWRKEDKESKTNKRQNSN